MLTDQGGAPPLLTTTEIIEVLQPGHAPRGLEVTLTALGAAVPLPVWPAVEKHWSSKEEHDDLPFWVNPSSGSGR